MPQNKKINLVSANMGYGHQRAAYPLLNLSGDEIITINDYKGMPDWERKYWETNLKTYERISRFKKVPLAGGLVFSVMDYFQRIKPFYPFRDLSKPTFQQMYFHRLIKKGLGKDLMNKLSKDNIPLVTTFFVAMYMAEQHDYSGDIYSIVCDADISRAWAPIHPKKSRSKFLVPNERVKERLIMYGVSEKNIYVTGFPLPLENVGVGNEILKEDLMSRLINLDTSGIYRKKESSLLKKVLGDDLESGKSSPISITFAVGGAGAQKEIGINIVSKLALKIKKKEIKINLVAGVRKEVKEYFKQELKRLDLAHHPNINIVFNEDKVAYFKLFNKTLRVTDILWTKPSELSFYSSLGIPIIMSETVGSQEDFNKSWLINIGAGINSLEVDYVNEWLPDMLESGRLARAAMDGFLNGNCRGAYNIENIIKK